MSDCIFCKLFEKLDAFLRSKAEAKGCGCGCCGTDKPQTPEEKKEGCCGNKEEEKK